MGNLMYAEQQPHILNFKKRNKMFFLGKKAAKPNIETSEC